MSIVITLLILGLMITVHELGHYLTSKLMGVKVEEFSIGFGQKIFSFTKGDTCYSMRVLPLGGFCRMHGMLPDEKTDEKCSFYKKPVISRMFIIAAGSVMNLLLATILLIIVRFAATEDSLSLSIMYGLKEILTMIGIILSTLQELITGNGFNNIIGPIGFVSYVKEAMEVEYAVVYLMAVVSANLGVLNLLPFPGLDGSRLGFLLIETIKGSPINPKRKAIIHGLGIALLILLIIIVAYQDVSNLLYSA